MTRAWSAKSIVKPAAEPAAKHTAAKPKRLAGDAMPKDMTVVVRTGIRTKHAGKFIKIYQMDFAEKIKEIRAGVPAQRVGDLAAMMGMSKEALMESLALSRATVNRKVQAAQTLSPEETERVMGVQALIGQVEAMIDEDAPAQFNAAKWLADWLATPLPALGGATPASFLDTVEGQKYVGKLLDMIQSGAYA
ncbi:MAG: antitoxin Xre/MbcA/ParS toxin-binding domain-containing protein [Telluria sp.]